MNRFLVVLFVPVAFAAGKKPAAVSQQTPLERYILESRARSLDAPASAPGSIWKPDSRLADAARDLRASQLDDVLTIQVVENASAIAKGSTKTQRTSNVKAGVTSIAGIAKPTGALANLVGASTDRQLDGEGTTSRDVLI